MRIVLAAAAAFAGAFGVTAAASAATITTADLVACNGLSACSVPGATVTSSPGLLQTKTVAGQQGLGVAGKTNGEIDHGEWLTVAFNENVLLDAFKVVFLYNGPEFGDKNEVGAIRLSLGDGSLLTYTINAIGENAATISSGLGLATNCGATTSSGSGCFLFSGRPLGDLVIASIAFSAKNLPTSAGNNSDYSLASLDYSEVPVPGAALLLLTGLGAAGMARKRRAA
ncbi:MAG: PEP-CTERM sorting domain-containing protein [Parvularculaceae bacterium]|nr:PEP-CTERM sorting domain-containing protein [Parvularculaceae bacterium]